MSGFGVKIALFPPTTDSGDRYATPLQDVLCFKGWVCAPPAFSLLNPQFLALTVAVIIAP